MLSVAKTTRRLPTTTSKECHTVRGYELARLPRALALLRAEVGDVALVELQLCLYISEQSIGVFVTLAHQHHNIEVAVGFKPHRDKDVKVCGLGVSSRPLCRILDCAVLADCICRFDVERRTGRMFARLRVVRIVREIVIHKIGVVGKQAFNTSLALRLRFVGFDRGVCLHLFTVQLPSA